MRVPGFLRFVPGQHAPGHAAGDHAGVRGRAPRVSRPRISSVDTPRLVLLVLLLPPSLAAQTLAVAFPDENRVLLFNGRTYDSIASVPVGLGPHEIAPAPDGRHLYVGNTGASPESKRHTITRIDVAEPTRTSAIDPGDCGYGEVAPPVADPAGRPDRGSEPS